jgi:TolB-like protein
MVVFSSPAQTVSDGVNTAFLDFENINMDPALDYLGGIIKGLLLYDLSQNEYIKLVNRSKLEDVMEEQNIRLSGLADDEENALKVGRILGADWLISGEYIYLGRDVLITISLTNVETAQIIAYSERGSSENTIHKLAEKVVLKLTGIELAFENENSIRSIISMKDETPGKVRLYSWVSGAEIFLDDEFIGYTGDDNKIPYIIPNIKAGSHRLRTHYWPFGEVDLPEMKFHDWDEDFEITSGEEIVIRANQKQFNSIIYDLQQLIRETYRYNEDSDPLILKNHKVQWYDRESNGHEIDYTIKSTMANEAFSVSISMVYDGIAYDWAFNSQIDEKIELKEIVKDVEVRLSYDRKRIDYSVWRKDIEQGMWQNQ